MQFTGFLADSVNYSCLAWLSAPKARNTQERQCDSHLGSGDGCRSVAKNPNSHADLQQTNVLPDRTGVHITVNFKDKSSHQIEPINFPGDRLTRCAECSAVIVQTQSGEFSHASEVPHEVLASIDGLCELCFEPTVWLSHEDTCIHWKDAIVLSADDYESLFEAGQEGYLFILGATEYMTEDLEKHGMLRKFKEYLKRTSDVFW